MGLPELNFQGPSPIVSGNGIDSFPDLLSSKSIICLRTTMATSTEPAPTSCKVMLSKHVANGLLEEVTEGVKTLEKPPHLVGFLANSDPAALMYAQWTEKTCHEK